MDGWESKNSSMPDESALTTLGLVTNALSALACDDCALLTYYIRLVCALLPLASAGLSHVHWTEPQYSPERGVG
jgi:hypothetical protein